MKRVGIYAGSFDPVHQGHISFALGALHQCKLDKVFFLVEPRPRRKQGVKSLMHRQEMVRLAIADEPRLGSIMIDQQQFTVTDTLPILQKRFSGAQLAVMMGDDVAGHLAEWPQVETLLREVELIIGARRGAASKIQELIRTIESTKGVSLNYNIINAPLSSISSSVIRRSLKAGEQPEGLTPPVERYIHEHRLYVSAGDSKAA